MAPLEPREPPEALDLTGRYEGATPPNSLSQKGRPIFRHLPSLDTALSLAGLARRIEEGCALVPPRQFIRTSGGSWSGLEGGLGRLGGVLGPLGGVLGALGDLLARLGGLLEASWGLLDVSWCLLARLGGILEASWGSKMRLRRHFWRLLGDFKPQEASKLRPKRAPSWNRFPRRGVWVLHGKPTENARGGGHAGPPP